MTDLERQILAEIQFFWNPRKLVERTREIGMSYYAASSRAAFPVYEGNWDFANDSLYRRPNSFIYGGYHESKN